MKCKYKYKQFKQNKGLGSDFENLILIQIIV